MVKFKRNLSVKKKDRTPWPRFSLGELFYRCLRLLWYWQIGLAYLIFGVLLMVLAGFVIYRYIAWFLGWE